MEGDTPACVRVRRRTPTALCRAGRRRLRKARRGRQRARVGRGQLHPVQPVRLRLPARHHPSLRRSTEEEVAAAPAAVELRARQGQGRGGSCSTRMAVSPLDCMGCGSVREACARATSLAMVPAGIQLAEQEVFDYCRGPAWRRSRSWIDATVKGSQFEQPLSRVLRRVRRAAARRPTSKLVTQLFGDRMYIANATGCSVHLGRSAPPRRRTR